MQILRAVYAETLPRKHFSSQIEIMTILLKNFS